MVTVVSVWSPRPEYQGWIDTLRGGIQAVLMDGNLCLGYSRKLKLQGDVEDGNSLPKID